MYMSAHPPSAVGFETRVKARKFDPLALFEHGIVLFKEEEAADLRRYILGGMDDTCDH